MQTEATMVLNAPVRAGAMARVRDYIELTKPRITALVVLTTFVGYALGVARSMDWWVLLNLVAGTALACGGTSALNQWWERDRDALMRRTRERPLPAARLTPDRALAFGVVLVIAGLAPLVLFVNILSALLTALTMVSYIFLYTPLKTRTWHCTLVGAVPGALPPMIGWAAARGTLDPGGWALFAILFVWQLPHFYAIAWMCRDDYERGGFAMLPVVDPTGRMTTRHIVGWSLILVPVSLMPALLGLVGAWYAAGAIVLGLGFVGLAAVLAAHGSLPHARRVFLGSVLYLPALFTLLVLDKISLP